jgi:hypothetical protein
MTQSYTNPKNDRRSLTHTGTEVGTNNLELQQNAANREDWVLEWTCPRKYDSITYSAGDHLTKFSPRSREGVDGDGATSTFTVEANIDPPNGEVIVDQMDYQPIIAIDTADGDAQLTVSGYDFDANEVTFEETPTVGSGNVVMWPIMTEGIIKLIGHDQFNNAVAALDTWGIPLHVFNDFDQAQNMTQVHLTGAATWQESEHLVVYLDSPRQIVWDDAEFPEGQYASTMEQRVDVNV